MDHRKIVHTDTIPIDLIIEILSRLSAKSIAVCRAVSKQWYCLLRLPDFSELFLTRSLIQPRRLLALEYERKWHFFSCPQPQNNLSVVSDYHMSFTGDWYKDICQSVHGLIFLMDTRLIFGDRRDKYPVICNPSTGQQLSLPKPRTDDNIDDLISFFGYDPIVKQYKVLCMTISHYRRSNSREHQVLTLGKRKLSWRKIKCSFPHYPEKNTKRICINGVLYYQARSYGDILIICFDVKSEKFSYIEIEKHSRLYYISALMNYKGKLCALLFSGGPNELWVLNGTEKDDKWSKHISVWLELDDETKRSIWINDSGEISWVLNGWTSPFYVYYYNIETTIHRRVEIKGIEDKLGMGQDRPDGYFTFMNHAENLMFP